MKMSDKEYLQVILEIEKNMSNNYSIAMNEASNDDLYENFFDMFTSIKDSARDIFDVMSSKGWYKLEEVEESKVQKTLDKLKNCLEQLDQEDE